jgi:hypothetical protein
VHFKYIVISGGLIWVPPPPDTSKASRAGQGAAQIGLMGESPELHASSLHFFAFQMKVADRRQELH